MASTALNSNKAITATFAQDEYTLSVASVHGAVTKTPDKATYHYGETVQVSVAVEAGYAFAARFQMSPTPTGRGWI